MKNKVSKESWYSIAVIILACVYVFAWFYSIHLAVLEREQRANAVMPILTGDSQDYVGLAQSLLAGNGFHSVTEPGNIPETFRTPGYPVFVAIFSWLGGSTVGSYFLVTLIQILLVFITALYIRRLGALFFSDGVGMAAALLFLVDPEVFSVSLIILSDILFVFLFVLGFYLLAAYLHKRPVTTTLLSALLFSFAVYVRPMGLFALPVFIAPVIIAQIGDTQRRVAIRQKLYSALVIVIIVCAALVPWMYRNYKETGVFAFSSLRAYNFASYNVPLFLATKGVPENQTFNLIEQQSGVPMEQWRNLADSAALNRVTDKILLVQPFSYIEYHLKKTAEGSLGSSVDAFINDYDHAALLPPVISSIRMGDFTHGLPLAPHTLAYAGWRIPERLFWVIIYLLMLVALIMNYCCLSYWAFFLIPVYIFLLAGPVFSDVRYRLPAEPFILLLACAGATLIAEHISWKRISQLAIVLRYISAGIIGVVVNIGFVYLLTHFFHVWYLISSTVAFIVALFVSFTLQKFWTFKNRHMNVVGRQFLVYLSIALFNLMLNALFVYLFTGVFGLWYVLSQLLSSGLIGLSSFFLYQIFVFSA